MTPPLHGLGDLVHRLIRYRAAVQGDEQVAGSRSHGGEGLLDQPCREHTCREFWQAGGVAEPHVVSDADDADDEAAAVEALVGDWSYLPDIAARYGVPLSRVRRHLADRELLTHRVGPNRALAVPSDFLGPLGPRPELKGTFTVLADGGMSDLEIIRWLHTVDTTLPGGDTPLTALAAGFKTEIRRRAQALAF